jgi:hypothetical protein
MKRLITICLVVAVTGLGCGEDLTDPGGTGTGSGGSTATSYQVQNAAGFPLYDCVTAYWNTVTEEIEDFVQHGTLVAGALTAKRATTRSVIEILFRLAPGGTLYLVTSPVFRITTGRNNLYTITGETRVYGKLVAGRGAAVLYGMREANDAESRQLGMLMER